VSPIPVLFQDFIASADSPKASASPNNVGIYEA